MTQRRLLMGGMVIAALGIGAALLAVPGTGPLLALAFLTLTAFLFGNWYRTSTTPARFETEASVPDSELFDGFTVYWTTESTGPHTGAVRTPAGIAR